jgi:hypothetical protein
MLLSMTYMLQSYKAVSYMAKISTFNELSKLEEVGIWMLHHQVKLDSLQKDSL